MYVCAMWWCIIIFIHSLPILESKFKVFSHLNVAADHAVLGRPSFLAARHFSARFSLSALYLFVVCLHPVTCSILRCSSYALLCITNLFSIKSPDWNWNWHQCNWNRRLECYGLLFGICGGREGEDAGSIKHSCVVMLSEMVEWQ